jgi:hypothetical protein
LSDMNNRTILACYANCITYAADVRRCAAANNASPFRRDTIAEAYKWLNIARRYRARIAEIGIGINATDAERS